MLFPFYDTSLQLVIILLDGNDHKGGRIVSYER